MRLQYLLDAHEAMDGPRFASGTDDEGGGAEGWMEQAPIGGLAVRVSVWVARIVAQHFLLTPRMLSPRMLSLQGGESLLENLPDIDAETGEVVVGGASEGDVPDGLASLSREELCSLVRKLRTSHAELQVRVEAAEMESAGFRKKLEEAKQKLAGVSSRKRAAVGAP